MIYLALAILSSALVSVVMRVGSGDSEARLPLLAVNYLACALVALAFIEGNPIPRGDGVGAALGMGAVGGVLFLGAFVLFQKNVRESGVALSSAFMKLGVVVPTVLGFTLFGERVGAARVAGILLTLAAIALLAGGTGGVNSPRLGALVLLMLWGGMADGLGKFYDAYGNPDLAGHYLFFVFACALVLCALMCAAKGQRLRPRDWLFGALLGVPNYFSSRFLLRALADVPASAAYPVFSCGAIALTALAGFVVFGERPGRRQTAALFVVLVALALLNV